MDGDTIASGKLLQRKIWVNALWLFVFLFLTIRFYVFNYIFPAVLFTMISVASGLYLFNKIRMRREKLVVLPSSFEVYTFTNHEIIPFHTIERVGIQIESELYFFAYFHPTLFLANLLSYLFDRSQGEVYAFRYEIITDNLTYHSTIQFVERKAIENFINLIVKLSNVKPKMHNYAQRSRTGYFWYFNFLNYNEYSYDVVLN